VGSRQRSDRSDRRLPTADCPLLTTKLFKKKVALR
jgi:hypothetical protein